VKNILYVLNKKLTFSFWYIIFFIYHCKRALRTFLWAQKDDALTKVVLISIMFKWLNEYNITYRTGRFSGWQK